MRGIPEIPSDAFKLCFCQTTNRFLSSCHLNIKKKGWFRNVLNRTLNACDLTSKAGFSSASMRWRARTRLNDGVRWCWNSLSPHQHQLCGDLNGTACVHRWGRHREMLTHLSLENFLMDVGSLQPLLRRQISKEPSAPLGSVCYYCYYYYYNYYIIYSIAHCCEKASLIRSRCFNAKVCLWIIYRQQDS